MFWNSFFTRNCLKLSVKKLLLKLQENCAEKKKKLQKNLSYSWISSLVLILLTFVTKCNLSVFCSWSKPIRADVICNYLHIKSYLLTRCTIYFRCQLKIICFHFLKHFGPGLMVLSIHSKDIISLLSFSSLSSEGCKFSTFSLNLAFWHIWKTLQQKHKH